MRHNACTLNLATLLDHRATLHPTAKPWCSRAPG